MTPMSDKIFFSYATVAPLCSESFEAVQTYLQEFYTYGPPDVLYKYDPLVDELANEVAALINCRPNEVTYVKNTTDGINIAADVIPFDQGDEIIVAANEYPANLLPWLKKRRDGLTVTTIPGTDSAETFERLINSVGTRTRVVAVSSTQYYDGYRGDMARLAVRCHENGAYLFVDAVQTIGVRQFDVQTIGADFVVCGGQKYLQAGPGSGFLYVSRQRMAELRHTRLGIRSMQHFTDDAYTLKPGAARFQDGTLNLPGIVALHAALKRINGTGMATIESRNLDLLQLIKDQLRQRTIRFIDHGDRHGNIVSMLVDDPKALVDYLRDQNIFIKQIKDVARLSFNYQTTDADIYKLADAIGSWQTR